VEGEFAVVIVAFAMITGAVLVVVISGLQRGKLREMAHRERLAMIEKGIAPPPEMDPGRFERAMGQPAWDDEVAARAARYRRIGVVFIGIGAALWFVITFAGDAPETGFGLGGAVAVLGVAFYVNSQLELKHAPRRSPKTLEPRNSGTSEP
jgi:hypothetical protein